MRILIIIVACVALYFVLRQLFRQNPKKFTRYFFFAGIGIFTLSLFVLAITGRLHWLFALSAALLPWLRRLLPALRYIPLLGSLKQFGGMRSGGASRNYRSRQNSRVSSAFFDMDLNHESGEISGEILTGDFQGRSLNDLSVAQLQQLLQACQGDQDSYALLCSYLNNRFGENWQAQFQAAEGPANEPGNGYTGNVMNRKQALDILGLSEPVTREEVIKAHRRMMQKFHPDRGGSNYLAAMLNEAKDHLLAEQQN